MLLKQLTEEMHISVSLKLMHWNGMECVCITYYITEALTNS